MKGTGRCAENCYIYLTNKLSCLASGYMKESLRDFFTFSTLERKGIMDELTLRTELQPNVGKDKAEEIRGRVKERAKVKTNLTMNVTLEAEGTLPRYDLKARRFKDLRGKE